ncbi:MAG: hypothetical protein RB191_13050 [Terriglobia bacterium]|nr:hypothetical protein [Terriglobia bacterium]
MKNDTAFIALAAIADTVALDVIRKLMPHLRRSASLRFPFSGG